MIWILVLILNLYSASIEATCYNPQGGHWQGFFPCSDAPGVQSCCESDSYCLSNHTCIGSFGYYSAPCTDPSYRAPECVQTCVDYAYGDFAYCGGDKYICCGDHAPCNCYNATGTTFSMQGPLSTIAYIPMTTHTYTQSSAPSSIQSTSISIPTSSPPSIASQNATPPPTYTGLASNITQSDGDSAFKFGIEVGMPSFMIILTLTIFAFFHFRRLNNSRRDTLVSYSTHESRADTISEYERKWPVSISMIFPDEEEFPASASGARSGPDLHSGLDIGIEESIERAPDVALRDLEKQLPR